MLINLNLSVNVLHDLMMNTAPDDDSYSRGMADAKALAFGMPRDRVLELINRAKTIVESGDFRNKANARYWLGCLEELQHCM